MSEVIHLISGPRNISTALMYAFGNRKDTNIIDEPFYAHYLNYSKVSYHPGTEEILNSQPHDPAKVINSIINRTDKKYLFVKNMAHHLTGFDYGFIHGLKNIFLIRDPYRLILSFSKVIARPTLDDIGIKRSYDLYNELKDGKYEPIVLDGSEVLKDPQSVLKKVCYQLGIPWDVSMLSWDPGPRKEDGVWAKYWYKNVHESDGFKPYEESKNEGMPEDLYRLYEEAMPYYEHLYSKAIKA